MNVRTNADTPEDAAKARELGAEGIGLCRTEHMFMAEDRQPKMRAMIMADDRESRRAALAELLPLQQEDFEGIFEAMAGLPVTIRLLDPPLHEFLPNAEDLAAAIERARIEDSHDLPELERLLDRVHDISEENPMLGTRGVPAGDPLPRDLRDAGPRDPARRQGRRRAAPPGDHDPARRLRAGARDHARAGRPGIGEEEGLEIGDRLHRRDDDRAAARLLRGRPDRPLRRLLPLRHQRPDPDGARLLPRRRRVQVRADLHGAQDHRPQPVRDDRQARRRLAGPARGVGRARGPPRPEARDLRRARRRPGVDRSSSTAPGSTTSPARRTGCRSRGSRPPRPRSSTRSAAGTERRPDAGLGKVEPHPLCPER